MITIQGTYMLDFKKVAKGFKSSQTLIDAIKHTRACGAELLSQPKFWVMLFTLAGITSLDGGMEALTPKGVLNCDENRALLATAVEVPALVPIIAETNPFMVEDDALNGSLLINTTAAFACEEEQQRESI